MTRVGKACAGRAGRQQRLGQAACTASATSMRRSAISATSRRTTPLCSVNSGYGGNVLLGKKCFALRIASYLGKNEGWMAEHMLILGIENPQGEVKYVAAAFPSACGKTNLAMLIPPEVYRNKGYKVWTVGDDIAWMRIGAGRPPVGHQPRERLLRRCPRHQREVQPQRSGFHPEGHHLHQRCPQPGRQHRVVGRPGQESAGERCRLEGRAVERQDLRLRRALIPTAASLLRLRTAPASAPSSTTATGVPISAIIFGGRRAQTTPLVYQSRDWNNGVFVGSIMASETTAAATGAVGVVRRDPMAMLPFCGYHMGDYFQHWIEMGEKLGDKAPKIFNVNWFRLDDEGHFIWPGFGDNMRVLEWIIEALRGQGRRCRRPPSAMCPRLRTSTWKVMRLLHRYPQGHPGSRQGSVDKGSRGYRRILQEVWRQAA